MGVGRRQIEIIASLAPPGSGSRQAHSCGWTAELTVTPVVPVLVAEGCAGVQLSLQRQKAMADLAAASGTLRQRKKSGNR